MDDQAGEYGRPYLVQLKLEAGDDAEVAAATAQTPKQLGVLGLTRADAFTSRVDDVGGDEIVAR